ncbi:septum formation family protein [Nocardiopsis gilva]|nr:septum formation family protein [Nocardiopsis gilva]
MPAVIPRSRAGRGVAVAAVVMASVSLSGCGLLMGNAFDIEVGECLASVPKDGEVFDVETIDCAESHEGEVYANVTLDDGEFPGLEKIGKMVDTRCREEFESFVGIGFDDSELDFTSLHPTEESWNTWDDRQVTCIVIDPKGTTGSLKGAER